MKNDPREVNKDKEKPSYDDSERRNYSSRDKDEWDDYEVIGVVVDE